MTEMRKRSVRGESAMPGEAQSRLYQPLARKLFDEIGAGRYAVGDRLPAERDLALEGGTFLR
jgi:GntR family transcriptional repressor for pyruvate dehydrogenase complex